LKKIEIFYNIRWIALLTAPLTKKVELPFINNRLQIYWRVELKTSCIFFRFCFSKRITKWKT
jgi:hypothetical protein